MNTTTDQMIDIEFLASIKTGFIEVPNEYLDKLNGIVKITISQISQPRPRPIEDRVSMGNLLAQFRALYREEPGEIEIPERTDRPNPMLEE